MFACGRQEVWAFEGQKMVLEHNGPGLLGGQVSGTAPHLPFGTPPWGTPLMEGITLWSRDGWMEMVTSCSGFFPKQ